MSSKKSSKFGRLGVVFAGFLLLISVFLNTSVGVIGAKDVFAVNSGNEQIVDNQNQDREEALDAIDNMDSQTLEGTEDDEEENEDSVNKQTANSDGCKSSLGALGWLVCPTTGKIAEAVDWLYGKIENILVIRPISTDDGTPIYEIWKYFLGFSNIVFIIFLLIVIYSQITGLGISNYGIKKSLPKLIVMAIVVNLSFLICLLAIDVSNIIGNSIRGLFNAIEQTTAANSVMEGGAASYSSLYSSLAGGTALAIGGGVIAFELGAIWMLIPTVLGAIVAVATGLITIALRQAVVVLLVMISPLAIVAYVLPNTEKWFRKWKELLLKMLIFYPMFSLLFGASSLAGFAIIMSAKDGFGLMLGMAVQIFPLFFSWKLMQMSGTFLGGINMRLRGMAARPLMANRAWAGSHMINSRLKHLSSERPITPSLRLMQFMSNRRFEREADINDNMELTRVRGMAYRARRNYIFREDGNVIPSRRGEEMYEKQARNLEYKQMIMRNANTMNKGFSYMAADGTPEKARLMGLDNRMVNAAVALKTEQARGEKIEYDNARGLYERMDAAVNAHMDEKNGFRFNERGEKIGRRSGYEFHLDPNSIEHSAALAQYNTMAQIMEFNPDDVQFAVASMAQGYDAQKKIVETKMQKYFEMTPPTQDLVNRLNEMTQVNNPAMNIDTILPGLRVLNQRGDTDLVRKQIENILNSQTGVDLGSHASQALASFLMFEVKDNDPFLRRFGKYINLETAKTYNENSVHPEKMRKNKRLSLNEYITGEYVDWEEDDWDAPRDERGTPIHRVKRGRAKRPATVLLEGTSLDGAERTAFSNLDEMIRNAYTTDGVLNVQGYLDKRSEIEQSIGPAFISASLKYLSGSEQLKNAVKFLTGYSDDGVPRWKDAGDALYGSEEAEKHFRGKTLKYLLDQTPSQILGLRSDYKLPLMEHLAEEYEKTEMKDWSDEAIAEREELMREKADIQTRYSDLPPNEAEERRNADMKALKTKMISAQFRQLLDSKGKLNQIYHTRRSGAANNAKDWVREWLNLDDELMINKKLNRDRERMKAREKRRIDESGEADDFKTSEGGVYSEADRAMFTSYIDDLWRDLRNGDDETFYEESLKYIRENLGEESRIAKMYEQFRKDDPYADSHMLKEYLIDLLNDEENY